MSIKIRGGVSTNEAEVNSDNELQVALSDTLGKAGYTALATENHTGASGAAKLQRALRSSVDRRLLTGQDTTLFSDSFVGTILNTSKYRAVTTSHTVAVVSNQLVLNSGASTGTGSMSINTFCGFPLYRETSLSVSFNISFTLSQAANFECSIGLGVPSGAAPYRPSDGVYLEIDNATDVKLVANYNGAIASVILPGFTFNANETYDCDLIVSTNQAQIWINDILYGTINRGSGAPALCMNTAPQFLFREAITSTTTGQQAKLATVSVTQCDTPNGKNWQDLVAIAANNAISAPDTATAGQTANYVNSTIPTNATASNTAAGYTTLGGQFSLVAPVGSETDLIMFGYQVPAMAVSGEAQHLCIKGITIDTVNTGAVVATTNTLLQWGIAVGSTAMSLATADAIGAGNRGPRRKGLGLQTAPVGTPIGGKYSDKIEVKFDVPLIAEAGTIVHIFVRIPVGTATASQLIRGLVNVDAYFA